MAFFENNLQNLSFQDDCLGHPSFFDIAVNCDSRLFAVMGVKHYVAVLVHYRAALILQSFVSMPAIHTWWLNGYGVPMLSISLRFQFLSIVAAF